MRVGRDEKGPFIAWEPEDTRREIGRLVNRIEAEVEELWHWLGDEPGYGDDGVAEAVVSMSNSIALVYHRLKKKGVL